MPHRLEQMAAPDRVAWLFGADARPRARTDRDGRRYFLAAPSALGWARERMYIDVRPEGDGCIVHVRQRRSPLGRALMAVLTVLAFLAGLANQDASQLKAWVVAILLALAMFALGGLALSFHGAADRKSLRRWLDSLEG